MALRIRVKEDELNRDRLDGDARGAAEPYGGLRGVFCTSRSRARVRRARRWDAGSEMRRSESTPASEHRRPLRTLTSRRPGSSEARMRWALAVAPCLRWRSRRRLPKRKSGASRRSGLEAVRGGRARAVAERAGAALAGHGAEVWRVVRGRQRASCSTASPRMGPDGHEVDLDAVLGERMVPYTTRFRIVGRSRRAARDRSCR